MIFGFNTDVRHEDTVYHVQSEARGDTLLRTHIFICGQCLGRCELSLVGSLLLNVFPDLQDALRVQHRQVLEAIRESHLEELLAPVPLELRWLDGPAHSDDDGLKLLFSVSASGRPVHAAHIVGRLDVPGETSRWAHAETAEEGTGALLFQIERAAIADSTLRVEAAHAGRRISTSFLLHTRPSVPSVTVAPAF